MDHLTANVPDAWIDKLDDLADEHGTSRAAVVRSVLDNGLRARKYHPDEFPIDPEQYEQYDAVELTQRERDGP